MSERTKKVTITLTPDQQDKARNLSTQLFGRENISGFIGFLIENCEDKKGRLSLNSFLNRRK